MKKDELVSALAEASGESKASVSAVLGAMAGVANSALAGGKSVSIPGVGKIDAPMPQRVFWCIFEGAVAIALLIGGGLAALQSMVISTGLLFTVVLLVMCYCIFKCFAAKYIHI